MSREREIVQPFSFSMPPSLVEELRQVAVANDRSLSYQARVALREWLDELPDVASASPSAARPAVTRNSTGAGRETPQSSAPGSS